MRRLYRVSAIAIAALSLNACATRGRLVVECDQFDRFVQNLPYSGIEQQIRDSVPSGGEESVGDPGLTHDEKGAYDRAIDAAFRRQQERLSQESVPDPGAPRDPNAVKPSILLLSGGGQWGAFGAGFLTTLAADQSEARPNPIAITGVSTGALQMLFVGAGLEDPNIRAAMRRAYSPAREKDVVNRGWTGFAAVTGSISGLKPLRARVENALCPDDAIRAAGKGSLTAECPLLDRLAAADTLMYSGFVEATSGRFQYADIGAIARDKTLTADQRRTCIAGAALASVAMPVFFQQVTVGKKTDYDGGVRQSVFATHIQRRVANQIVQRHVQQAPTPVLVLRNGPTDVEEDTKADGTRNALDSALRAQAIIVNQVEVTSVAALRLQNPAGHLGFASADGWRIQPYTPPGGTATTCGDIKSAHREAQFVPDFMQCIMAYGERRARANRVWLPLLTIGPPADPLRQVPAPSNDN